MSELRRDPIVGRWIIVDASHPKAPADYKAVETHSPQGGHCPFCYGNEMDTPFEIDSIRDPQTPSNAPGWQVRVVSNKYPALKIEGNLDKKGIGIYDMSNGIGAHEVLVETPYHHKDITDLLDEEAEKIILMYLNRSEDLARDRRFKYVMIFKNYGPAAGASVEHPHTQIIALPMVPKNVLDEIRGAEKYFEFRGRCIFCDIIRQEREEKERVILENEDFLAFCPFISRFPFEVWIMPKEHHSRFSHLAKQAVPGLAGILKQTIGAAKKLFGNISYNYIIHTSPENEETENAGYHWHIEFIPKLMRVAGFEWGSGFYLVPTPPELAAKYLKT